MAVRKKKKYNPLSVVVFVIIVLMLIAGSALSGPSPRHTINPSPEPHAQEASQATQQNNNRATTLSYAPASETAPLTKIVGETFTLEVMINPGQNVVSFVMLDITYDPTKLQLTQPNGFRLNGSLPSILSGPQYRHGRIITTLSIGADPTLGVRAPAKIATMSFKTLAPTDPNSHTEIAFGDIQVLSIAPQDGASENVFKTGIPARIVIK